MRRTYLFALFLLFTVRFFLFCLGGGADFFLSALADHIWYCSGS